MINPKQLKQMQKMMQETLAKIQQELAEAKIEGHGGGNKVTVVVNGQQEILSIKIDPGVVNPEEVDLLEDLVMVAVKEALDKSRELSAQKMGQLTGGLSIPGLM